jgi:hypothetical protein
MGIVFPLGPGDGLVPVEDAWTWPHWAPGHEGERVLLTSLPDLYVSTIHVGFDPRGDDAPGPHCPYETLVLGGPLHRREELHPSREAAIRRHLELVQESLARRGAAIDVPARSQRTRQDGQGGTT